VTGIDRRSFVAAAGAAAGLSASGAALGSAAGGAPRIKVGQIGVGHAHASKLSVYLDSPDYEVVGVSEPDPALRAVAAADPLYRDLPWMTPEQLLNVPGLQAVLVETRVADLLDVAETCIAAGKHIHLDKPAGTDLAQFERIVADAARQNLLIQMGYMYRYNPGVVMLREFLRQGWLGDVFEVHAVMSKVVDAESRADFAKFAGGILYELGGHLVDLTVGILGAPQEALGFLQHASAIDDGLEDNGLAVLKYPRALASVKSSAQEVEGFGRRHLAVCGSEGTFHIQPLDDPAVRLALAEPRGGYRAGYQDVALPKYVRYVGDAADMARIVRGEKATDFPYEHDLAVQRTLLKICGAS
jgi:predicted dehydrogenase